MKLLVTGGYGFIGSNFILQQLSKTTNPRASSGCIPLIDSTLNKAKNFSLSFGGRICPDIKCPVLSLKRLI